MMESEQIPVKRLKREEFTAAISKGQGRALLHVLHFDLDEVVDLVLEACLHNQVYDQQIESGRADWLFPMFRDSSYYSAFRTAILNSLKTETNNIDLYQLTGLAENIVALGDVEVRQALRELIYRIAADPAEFDWINVEDWFELEGAEGLLQIARIYGQRLLADPDEFVNDSILSSGEIARYWDILDEYSKSDRAINIYREYLQERRRQLASIEPVDKEERKKQLRIQIRNKYSLQGILEDAKKGKGRYGGGYRAFGRHATEEELDQVYACVMSETDEAVQTRLLRVFHRAKLPRLEQRLFDWAGGENEKLREAAITALAQISDIRVHDFARMKVETGSLLGADNNALDLFLHNYESSDALWITKSLVTLQPGPEDAHSLGFGLRQLAEKYQDPSLAEAMLWVYENTPCGFCRYLTITLLDQHNQFNDRLRFECQYDANKDTQEFALKTGKI